MSVLHDPGLERLLDKLHAESDAQTQAIRKHYDERDSVVGRPPEDQAAQTKTFLSDKLYALETNSFGQTWHISSDPHKGYVAQSGIALDYYSQFGALDVLAAELVRRVRVAAV